MASTKIQNLPLKAPIGAMKIPTGGFGDYSITVSSIGDFIIDTFNLATKDYVDNLLIEKEDRIDTTGGFLTPVSQNSNVPDTTNDVIDEVAQALLDRIEYVKDNFSAAPSHNELTGRSATGAHPSTSISHKSGTVYTYLSNAESDINTINNVTIPTINQSVSLKQDQITTTGTLIGTPEETGVNSVSHTGINGALQGLLNRSLFNKNHNNLTNRSDANSHPASAISYDSGSVSSFLDNQKNLNNKLIQVINSVADLIAYTPRFNGEVVYVKSYYANEGKGGGYFVYDQSRVSENNSVYTFNGWIRQIKDSKLSVHDAGAKGDGVTDDSTAINNLMQTLWDLGLHSNGQLNDDSFEIYFEGNLSYYIASPILHAPNTTINGNGCTLYGNNKTNDGIRSAWWVNGVLTDLTTYPLETSMQFRTHIKSFLFKQFRYSMNLKGMTFGCSVIDCSSRFCTRHISSIEHYFLHVVRNKAETCDLGYYFSTFSGMLQFQTVSASNCTLGFHFASAAQAIRINNISAEQCTNGIFIEGSGNTGGISIRSCYFEGISGKAVECQTNTYGSVRIGDCFVNITGTLAKETGNCKFIIEDDNWLQNVGIILDASTSTTSRSRTVRDPMQHNGGSNPPNSPNGTATDKSTWNTGGIRLWACNTHEHMVAQKDTVSGNTIALHRHYLSYIPYQFYGHQGTAPSNVVPFCSHTATGTTSVTNVVITTAITPNSFATGIFNLEILHDGLTKNTKVCGKFYGTDVVLDVTKTGGTTVTGITGSISTVSNVYVLTISGLVGDMANYRCRGFIKLI